MLAIDTDLSQAYVKCELHVASQDEQEGGQIPKGGKNKGGEWKRKTASHHSHDPDFSAETMDFHGVSGAVPELSFVRYVETFPFQCDQGFMSVVRPCYASQQRQSRACLVEQDGRRHTIKLNTTLNKWALLRRNVTERPTALFCERLGSAPWLGATRPHPCAALTARSRCQYNGR